MKRDSSIIPIKKGLHKKANKNEILKRMYAIQLLHNKNKKEGE